MFDRVATRGARFDHAFVSAPSCTPSRGALYTGRHFFRNGSASQLHSRWRKGEPDPFDAIVGMPEALARGGYHIGWSHKWHLPVRLMRGKEHHYGAGGGRINQFSQNVTKASDSRSAIFNEVRANFLAFLADRKQGQPFFYSFNPTNTHRQDEGMGKLQPLAWEKRPPEELYDLKSDPHQIHNLAADFKYSATLGFLRWLMKPVMLAFLRHETRMRLQALSRFLADGGK